MKYKRHESNDQIRLGKGCGGEYENADEMAQRAVHATAISALPSIPETAETAG